MTAQRDRQHRQYVRELLDMFTAAHDLMDAADFPPAGPREPWETWRARQTTTNP